AIQTFLKTEIDYLVLDNFIVRKADNRAAVTAWRESHRATPQEQFAKALRRHHVTRLGDICVLTDGPDCPRPDRVSPLFPEHQFFRDELDRQHVHGAVALDIGAGAGALSITVAKAGARKVVALETNPRARTFAGFNLLLNGCADRVEILAGDADAYRPIRGR